MANVKDQLSDFHELEKRSARNYSEPLLFNGITDSLKRKLDYKKNFHNLLIAVPSGNQLKHTLRN